VANICTSVPFPGRVSFPQVRNLCEMYGYWGVFPGIKWTGREGDHSPPTAAELKTDWT
jgi:hypothetical protein